MTYGFSADISKEEALIKEAKKGSRDAFEELMNCHLKIIYNYVSAHVHENEDVKDIVQETMLAVWNSIKGFENGSSFRTWVLSIAKRKTADYYRAAYRNDSVPITDYENTIEAEDDFERINNKIVAGSILNVLDNKEKEIVFLVFNAQLTYTEVSEIMKIPVGTIKSRMSAIKAKLKNQLGEGSRI